MSFASLDGCLDLIRTQVNYISKCTEEEAVHDRINRLVKKQVLFNLFNSLIASTITVYDVLENALVKIIRGKLVLYVLWQGGRTQVE